MEKSRKIRILHFAKFQSLLMVLLGTLFGILYSFGGLFIDTLVTLEMISEEIASSPGLSHGTFLAFGALIGMPILFGLLGFFAGITEAVLFNLVSKWFGGFQLNFFT